MLGRGAVESTRDVAAEPEVRAQCAVPAVAAALGLEAYTLNLQRTAGNRAVARAVAAGRLARRPTRRVLARSTKTDAFTVTAQDLDHLRDVMRQLVAGLDYATRWTLIRNRTLVIGLVVDDDGEPHLAYSTSQNWTAPKLRDAAEKLGVLRWDETPYAAGRGAVGAPGDAEQLLIQNADHGNFRVAAMAVSRGVCVDCNEAIKDYPGAYKEHPRPPITVIVEPAAFNNVDRALNKIRDDADTLREQLKNIKSEHQAQRDLIDKPSVTGFAGWVVDKFNKAPLPQMAIWGTAESLTMSLTRIINGGDPLAALRAYLEARRAYVIAVKRYVAWKNGLDGAAAATEVAIGVVAVATVIAIVAGVAAVGTYTGVTGAGAAAGAGATAAEGAGVEQTLVRVADLVTKADKAIAATDAYMEEQLLEQAEVEAEEEALKLMVR